MAHVRANSRCTAARGDNRVEFSKLNAGVGSGVEEGVGDSLGIAGGGGWGICRAHTVDLDMVVSTVELSRVDQHHIRVRWK